jgi:hypothetical protein
VRFVLLLKLSPRHAGLADDRLERPDAQLLVVGHGDRGGPVCRDALHEYVAAALPDAQKAVLFENGTHFLTGQHPELTHGRPRPA